MNIVITLAVKWSGRGILRCTRLRQIDLYRFALNHNTTTTTISIFVKSWQNAALYTVRLSLIVYTTCVL